MVQPNYRDTEGLLAEARANFRLAGKSVEAGEETGNSSFIVGGAIAATLLFPLLGFIALSPATRARFHLLRGKYTAAAQIYERILVRHPNRVKLYSLLASIYLLMGRRDEQAMKIYKMILQLHLTSGNREEISSIVAQNYLTEGRTDSDAIEVLESALKAEQRKQSR